MILERTLSIILGTGDSSNSDLTKLTPQGNFSINLQLPTSLCVYVGRDQVSCMFVSICVYTLFHKKKVFNCFFSFVGSETGSHLYSKDSSTYIGALVHKGNGAGGAVHVWSAKLCPWMDKGHV